MKNVGQTTSEVDQINRGRSARASVRAKPLGMGQEGTEEAQGDLQGQSPASPAPLAGLTSGKIERKEWERWHFNHWVVG
jgi:hypothetical protein